MGRNPSNRKPERETQPPRQGDQQGSTIYRPPSGLSFAKSDKSLIFVIGALLAAAFVWSYWPVLAYLVGEWDAEPDYSHGYFVVPLAVYFLWARKDRFPGASQGIAWAGLILVAAGIVMRAFGARYFIVAIEGWSIMLWAGGVAWLLWGRRVFLWSLPSIAFLFFMVPLPHRVERWLSLPLQRVATKLSSWTLQFLGQPAISEGNTIHMGPHQLNVEEACSGLRIFVGIVALAFAYVIIVRRPMWEKALLLLSVLPIALIANATRIVGMGLLFQWVSSDAAKYFAHDFSGYVMIPFAASLFALVLWYLGRLMPEVELVDIGESIRRKRV